MPRVVLLGFWHVHALEYGRQVQSNSELTLVAGWDDDVSRGREGCETLGVPFIGNLDDILADSSIDAVICEMATAQHRVVIKQALAAGKHVFSEKVLAATGRDARELVRLAEKHQRILFVGLAAVAHDYTRTIHHLIRSGELGQLISVRSVAASGAALTSELPTGFFSIAEAEGGALIDLCHALYLVLLLAGEVPEKVTAVTSHLTGREVEDSAAVTLTFSSKMIGLVETSFVSGSTPFVLEANGTLASVRFTSLPPNGSRVLIRRRDDPTFSPVTSLPAGRSPVDEWSEHLRTQAPATANLELAVLLSSVVEASYLAAATSRTVRLLESGEIQRAARSTSRPE